MYHMHTATLLFVWLFTARGVVSEDFFHDDCSDSFYALAGCVFNNGFDMPNIMAPECSACMEASNSQDTSKFSCDELITHVRGSMDACQSECAVPGCTLELTTMMTCFNVKSSECQLYTSTPSASPSRQPTLRPTVSPTAHPTMSPSDMPSDAPSDVPTGVPSGLPTSTPSAVPTQTPSDTPTRTPSSQPTTTAPTLATTASPTSSAPTIRPSYSGLRKNDDGVADKDNGPFGPLLELLQAMGNSTNVRGP